ncbi:uncharacterized protein Tco025E_09332 [Trypanosoma conorhini]|uniref:Uncharacterized protein n=1 Tax=Trypanosoma conorhini TaxID=83891 RepID=A0A3R7M8H9_9TRYP|nr:uncharacterized protein Tco025E_09332 [Trypanosoma conorhini]RNE98081.1 hypothetical protein Tco025E_09332 [Trypanosoma conorhini]
MTQTQPQSGGSRGASRRWHAPAHFGCLHCARSPATGRCSEVAGAAQHPPRGSDLLRHFECGRGRAHLPLHWFPISLVGLCFAPAANASSTRLQADENESPQKTCVAAAATANRPVHAGLAAVRCGEVDDAPGGLCGTARARLTSIKDGGPWQMRRPRCRGSVPRKGGAKDRRPVPSTRCWPPGGGSWAFFGRRRAQGARGKCSGLPAQQLRAPKCGGTSRAGEASVN